MRSTICLAMLAHNEGDKFQAIYDAIGSRLDAWCIVVNPDDHATADAAYHTFSTLPGQAHYRPWHNHWANARNELLDLARKQGTNYILILDPDTPITGIIPNILDAPAYGTKCIDSGTEWLTTVLVQSSAPYQYIGSVHEVLDTLDLPIPVLPDTLLVRSGTGGGEPRMRLVIDILTKEIAADPTNTRTMFYLAQTYRDLHDTENAIKYYTMRAEAGGWDQEVYWSLLQIADLTGNTDDYLTAYNYRPCRIEALHRLAGRHNALGKFHSSLMFSRMAMSQELSVDQLFLERWIIDYGILLEHSVARWHTGDRDEAYEMWEHILKMDNLMPVIRDKVTVNLANKYAIPTRINQPHTPVKVS